MPSPSVNTGRKPNSTSDLKLLARFADEEIVRHILPNGLVLLVKPDCRTAVASVQVWVKTGSIYEGENTGAGLSHYLEHLLFKGTARREGRQISEEVQAHGGYINAYTTFDRTVYYIDIPSEYTDVAVDVLADMLLHSKLDLAEAEKEREVILREIAMGEDDPDQRLGQALFSTAFRQHPYRNPIIGYRDVFNRITHDALTRYYRERYVPNNLVVIITGDVAVSEIVALVQAHFGAAARRPLASPYVPAEPPQLAERAWHQSADVELTRAGLAWQIPGLTHPDTPALNILAMILGAGDSSILWQEIREKKGLVHAIDVTSWAPGTSGLFYISFTCDAAKRKQATVAILAELERVKRSRLRPAQLRKTIRQLVVGEINTRKTVSGQASRLGVAEVVVGDLHFSQSYFERLATLTPADIQRALCTYLIPHTCSSVSLSPNEEVSQAKRARKTPRTVRAFQEITLPNGGRVLLQPDTSLPNVHLRLCGLGGALYEVPERRGVTSLFATLLTKDTEQRTSAQVAQHIEEVGGSFYPMSGNNSFGLALEVLPGDLRLAHELLSDAVHSPRFRKATLEQEREAQLAALQDDNDNVTSYGLRLLRRHFFGAHPLAIGANGSEDTLSRITQNDLRSLHRQLIQPGNLVFVAVGDFDPKTMRASATKLLGHLPKGCPLAKVAPFPNPALIGEVFEPHARQQAVVFEAYPCPSIADDAFFVSEVMDELFSGMSSRLFERVRDELSLAYYVRSSRMIGLDTSLFYFYAGTEPGKEAAVLREVEAEIARVVCGGVESSELDRCKIRLKAAHRMGLQTNAARALQAALNTLYGRPADDTADYDRQIDAVPPTALSRFAKKYFAPALRLRLTLSPQSPE